MTKSKLLILLVLCGMVQNIYAASLYDENNYTALVSDNRSYKQGDSLTVLIYESASATSSATTNAGRKSEIGLSASDGHKRINGDIGLRNKFEGKGGVTRSGKLMASVSATVQSVAPNGDMYVEGYQYIVLNNEKQRISVKGRVRPVDISPENTVVSTRLADAKIEFRGKGLISDKQKPGLISRFFHWLL